MVGNYTLNARFKKQKPLWQALKCQEIFQEQMSSSRIRKEVQKL